MAVTETGVDDEVLHAERRHLAHARDCLAAMRESVRALQARGGDPVSDAYLAAALHRRQLALVDDPGAPLFFGRIDRQPGVGGEQFYIGRRYVRDDDGEPVVLDWRARTSRDFYRASPTDPMGLRLRRRYGFSEGTLTGLEDERLDLGATGEDHESGVLTAEIERPRVGPMRDIVATIQPEQDELVRAELTETVCVQGAPGTGKTAVGLHRAAYLLYTYGDHLRRAGVLVVGPNRSFLGYIGALLPALGEVDVAQVAVEDLVDGVEVTGSDDAETARLKGDERMAQVLLRALWSRVRTPTEDLVVEVGSRRWRLPAYELAALLDGERERGKPYGAVREQLGRVVAEVVRRRIEADGGAPDDREVARIARAVPVRRWVDAHWPAVDPAQVLWQLLSDPRELAAAADGVLDVREQQALLWASPPARPRRARWSLGDAFCLDELAGLLQRPASYGHLVVDEAQDLSAMQCRALARRCPTGSATVLGDVAQATASAAVADWDRTLALLGQPDGRTVRLTRGYRVPRQVLDFANRLLPALDVDVQPSTSVRSSPGSLRVQRLTSAAEAVHAVRALLDAEGSVGVIGAGAALDAVVTGCRVAGIELGEVEEGMAARVTAVPVTLAKGLEFDHVVVLEPARIAADLPRGHHWLYVALTRAVSSLTVLHSEPLPAALEALPAR